MATVIHEGKTRLSNGVNELFRIVHDPSWTYGCLRLETCNVNDSMGVPIWKDASKVCYGGVEYEVMKTLAERAGLIPQSTARIDDEAYVVFQIARNTGTLSEASRFRTMNEAEAFARQLTAEWPGSKFTVMKVYV